MDLCLEAVIFLAGFSESGAWELSFGLLTLMVGVSAVTGGATSCTCSPVTDFTCVSRCSPGLEEQESSMT